MANLVQCQGCKQNLQVPDELAGKRIKYAGCGHILLVPPQQSLNATVGVPPVPALDACATATVDEPAEPCAVPSTQDRTAVFAAKSSPNADGQGASVPGQGTEVERRPPAVSVPGYDIEGVLGRGGMGIVYKARQLTLKRTVALKMILASGHAGPQERARFRIEAEAVARLQHPNIVQIHEVGTAGEHPCCALEFVDGGNLASRLDGKPMPARAAAQLVEALARAMQLAHSRNVVHRDLKPANILLTADDTPKITDFGLARQLDTDSNATQAGAVMGTPSYMAPEQAAGRAHEAGPAADVYALGAILYACLTGRPPFQGQSIIETLEQVRTQKPPPPSRRQASVPSIWIRSVSNACARSRSSVTRPPLSWPTNWCGINAASPSWRGRWVGASGPSSG